MIAEIAGIGVAALAAVCLGWLTGTFFWWRRKL